MKSKIAVSIITLILMFNKMSSQEIYGRFDHKGYITYGKVVNDLIYPLDNAPWKKGKIIGEGIKISDVKLLHPSEPQVILGLGGSYANASKDKTPHHTVRWFLKPPSAAGSPNDVVYIPESLDALKVEVELTIVVGKTIKNATEKEAEKAIFGYTIGNDIVGWTNSYYKKNNESKGEKDVLLGPGLKIGDRFAPFGPFIYTNFDWTNRERSLIITDKNGIEKENTTNNTSNLAYSPGKILSDLSKVLTLNPGDIVLTGTNKSYVVTDGDTVKLSIEGLGVLTNYIKK